jgi:predicted nucleotide-binding protein
VRCRFCGTDCADLSVYFKLSSAHFYGWDREMSTLAQKIEELIEAGWNVQDYDLYVKWVNRVFHFLERAFDKQTANEFNAIHSPLNHPIWELDRSAQIGMLEGLALHSAQETVEPESGPSPTSTASRVSVPLHPKRVFVVHGHDTETKESVARFIERLGLEPIILHEQPNSGRTIIEKFEVYSDVGFAVVLLTPDDVGAPASNPADLKGRARQNVILELGYFNGKLSRRRVCALYKPGVEIPSDYQGVIYVELDTAGAWRTKLAQELVEAGFSIKLEALLKS